MFLKLGDEAACLLEVGKADEEKWFQHGIQLLSKAILMKEDSWLTFQCDGICDR